MPHKCTFCAKPFKKHDAALQHERDRHPRARKERDRRGYDRPVVPAFRSYLDPFEIRLKTSLMDLDQFALQQFR